MITVAQKNIELLKIFAEAKEARKQWEKKEKEAQKLIAELMGDENMLQAGEYVVTYTERNTTSFDKAALTEQMGIAFVKQFETQSKSKIMNINKI